MGGHFSGKFIPVVYGLTLRGDIEALDHGRAQAFVGQDDFEVGLSLCIADVGRQPDGKPGFAPGFFVPARNSLNDCCYLINGANSRYAPSAGTTCGHQQFKRIGAGGRQTLHGLAPQRLHWKTTGV